MGTLRDAMSRDLLLRGYSESTRYKYVYAVAELARYHHQAPDQLGLEHVLEYLEHLKVAEKAAGSTLNVRAAGLRFFYRVTLGGRDWVRQIPWHRSARRVIPEILSPEEVTALINAPANVKHKAIIATAYGSGLRVSEVCRLLVSDVDSQRMVVRVHEGKGRKDRYVPLSPTLLGILRNYYRAVRPKTWLFPSEATTGHLSRSTLWRIVKAAAAAVGIKKRVTFHSVRHSYTTHSLEQGHGLLEVQANLGHESLLTTFQYLHAAVPGSRPRQGPIDALSGLKL
jgi:site-specific recombinase XerD